jgi:hypothetical protein
VLSLAWIIIIIVRKDLKTKILRTSIAGGFAGIVSEFWYLKDYWQPPSLLGRSTISIEDFLFGFFITGIIVSIYDIVFRKRNIKQEKERKIFFGILFLMGVIFLLIFNNWLGVNSIFVSSFVFIIFSAVMIFVRKDLLMPSILSGLLTVIIIIPIYVIFFNIISPEYWDKYWLLTNTKFGIMVLGNIPATELLWYFSFGCLAGIAYDFADGNTKITIIA